MHEEYVLPSQACNKKERGVMQVKHWKKMAAPIVIASIIIVYYIGMAAVFMAVPGIPTAIKILMIVVPLILAAVMLGVLISRIKEIQGGEEDDLSQY